MVDRMKRPLAFVLLLSLILSSVPHSLVAQTVAIPPELIAQGFNPNAILDDSDMFDLGDWDASHIQRFLESKQSALATMQLRDIDGDLKRPADIIWRVAGSYKLSPKYLLAVMQKEQSLVEDMTLTQRQLDWAMGFGVCDSCAMNDPAIQAYKGFANQIEYAAKQHRERYLFQILGRGATISGQAPGKTSLIDNMRITPANRATAMLYTYTPHLHGNQNLWLIWRRWFARSLPDGTIVAKKNQPQERYLIRNGERRPLSPAVYASLVSTPDKVVSLTEADLGPYPEGDAIKFPNFSLVENASGTRFLLSGAQKRTIVSKKVFRQLGFIEDEIVEVSDSDLSSYTDGPDLTAESRYPTGLLAKDTKGAYWYIEDGTRHLIPNTKLLKFYFKGRPARTLTSAEWKKYPIGNPYRLHDGELVRGTKDASVYVVDHEKLRVFPSSDVFLALGYTWKNVLTLPDALLKDYAKGEPMEPAWQQPVIPLTNSEASLPSPSVTTTLSSSSL